MRYALALAAAVAVTSSALPRAAWSAPSPAPSVGSRLVFLGWSRDSRLVAYTRVRPGKKQPLQRLHRFVRDGAFAGFGRMVGGDVETYARERGYVATPVPRRALGANRWELLVGGRALTLTLEVGAAVSWALTDGERTLARHTFDRIYVACEPELYPSPDGRQAVLVMHLDTGWETDAAIFPVALARGDPGPGDAASP